MIRESSCQFGEGSSLAGIITEPPQWPVRSAWILISAGLMPKAGPFGLYSQLARKIAQGGAPVLRFDLGGIGDSRVAYPQFSLGRRTELEIRAAVDFMAQRFSVDSLTLCGLCSGAEDSLRYAINDSRISKVVMIDTFAYRTAGWKRRQRLKTVARHAFRTVGLHSSVPVASESSFINYKYMDYLESSRSLSTLLERKVDLHFIYTGGMSEVFNHKGQFKRMFPTLDLRRGVAIDHFPEMGHTQLLEEDRQRLVNAIARRA